MKLVAPGGGGGRTLSLEGAQMLAAKLRDAVACRHALALLRSRLLYPPDGVAAQRDAEALRRQLLERVARVVRRPGFMAGFSSAATCSGGGWRTPAGAD